MMKSESMTSGEERMPAALKLSRIQKKGQVTIPVEIREQLGLKEGDLVAFVEMENGILISPREAIALEALDRIGQALQEAGVTLDELIESGRDIRGELMAEKYGLSQAQWDRNA
jgi:AbrB family looped-hinge helix DNA binding protein